MAKVHFDEIDIVKGIAILFVLWHHSFIKFPIYMLDIPWCEYAMAIHGTFYLNVFFLLNRCNIGGHIKKIKKSTYTNHNSPPFKSIFSIYSTCPPTFRLTNCGSAVLTPRFTAS